MKNIRYSNNVKFVIVILTILTIASCSHKILDFGKIDLPISQNSIIPKIEYQKGSDYMGVITYSSKDKGILYFDNQSLSGSMTGNTKPIYGNNYVELYVNKSNNMIESYELIVETENEARKLEKALEAKLGKTAYYYKYEDASFRIWEHNSNTYFFEVKNVAIYTDKKAIACQLSVVNKGDAFLYEYYTSTGGFSYYDDYLQAKEQQGNTTYTYKDFLNQMKEEGMEHLLEGIVE